MHKRAIWLSLCLLLAITLTAQQPSRKDIEKELEKQYKGKVFRAKLSFPNYSIQFDSDGNPKHKPGDCESWTLCNLLQIDNVSVTDHSVKVEGQRIGVAFENGKEKLFLLRDRPGSVEVDTSSTPDLTSARIALCKVFTCGNDNFADYLPYAWARYFDPKTTVLSPAVPVNDKAAAKVEASIKTLRVSQGVMASKLLSQVPPHYPDTAKAYRREGTVSMQATIGKDGRIRDLFLTHPAGFGLDEEAMTSVRKWVYRPVMLEGQPVEVETTINVNFALRK